MAGALAVQSVGAVGIPSLQRHGRDTRKGESVVVKQLCSGGLHLVGDRKALKSAFYNAGSSLVADASAPSRISMKVASKGAYVCRDCGYIYNDRKPFEQLSIDYSCPVCAAPKRRFKPYDMPVAKNSNDLAVRKARKEDLKKSTDSALGLPVAILVGAVGLVGTFLYLNSTL